MAAERVRKLLSGRSDVVEKKMVGGLSFLVNGNMCCGITGMALMVRVGAESREQALREPHVRPMLLAGRALSGFICIEPEGYAADDALASWVQRGLELRLRAPGQAGPREQLTEYRVMRGRRPRLAWPTQASRCGPGPRTTVSASGSECRRSRRLSTGGMPRMRWVGPAPRCGARRRGHRADLRGHGSHAAYGGEGAARARRAVLVPAH